MTRKFSHRIIIPPEIRFADLRLSRDPHTLELEFDWQPIEAICTASQLDIKILRDQHEENVCGLIIAWYAEHRQAGGESDAVMEQIIREIRREDAAPYN